MNRQLPNHTLLLTEKIYYNTRSLNRCLLYCSLAGSAGCISLMYHNRNSTCEVSMSSAVPTNTSLIGSITYQIQGNTAAYIMVSHYPIMLYAAQNKL